MESAIVGVAIAAIVKAIWDYLESDNEEQQ